MSGLIKGFVTGEEGAWLVCRDTSPHNHSAVCNWERVSYVEVEAHIRALEERLQKVHVIAQISLLHNEVAPLRLHLEEILAILRS